MAATELAGVSEKVAMAAVVAVELAGVLEKVAMAAAVRFVT
jgi:hypothetical protein